MRGHLKQRSKGSWTIWIELPRTPDGKRRQRTFTVRGTKRQAEIKLATALHELDGGMLVSPSRVTVGEYLEAWMRDYARPNLAPSTAEIYDIIVRRHLGPGLGLVRLDQLKPDHPQRYYTDKLACGRHDGNGGLSSKTVLHHHRLLRQALSHAVKLGLLVRNVAEAVQTPKPRHVEMSTLSPEGVHRFLEVARETPYYSLFHTALYTGMRRGELLALRWKDVDLDMATLSVVRSIYKGSGGDFTIREPKTQRSRRLIALSPSLALVLRDHQAERQSRSILIGKTIPELVFSHLDGSPLDPSTVSHAFGKVIKKARLPSVRFHDLRHTHATLMMRQGINPQIVSERLGHSTVAMTLDLYSHVVPGLQEQAALRFDEGLQREVGAVGTENGAGGFG